MDRTEYCYFGPPGCGKTHTLMQIIRDLTQEEEMPVEEIGFVSFSRKAIREARERAGSDLSLTEKQTPNFKTLHSMCYRALGLSSDRVMGSKDYKEIGRMMHHDLLLDAEVDESTGVVNTVNPYLRCIELANAKKTEVEQEFNRMNNPNMDWSLQEQIKSNLEIYKRDTDKLDFSDMLSLFAAGEGNAPELEALIVDEAQDLTPLQWSVVQRLKQSVRRVYYAGDDDQAIHKWAGVEASDFINCTPNKIVLDQSYRVPKLVHELANRLIRRVDERYQKHWNPTDKEGYVGYHSDMWNLDFGKGSWTIMARTNGLLVPVMQRLNELGYLYSNSEGKTNISKNILEAKNIWERLCKGNAVYVIELRRLYDQMPKNSAILKRGAAAFLDTLDPEIPHRLEELQQSDKFLATADMPWFDVIKGVNDGTRQRFDAIARREGTENMNNPRIKVSTIHRMKGGEDDNIVLMSDTSWGARKYSDLDDERRVFYTGVTRAKDRLHIILPQTKLHFEELVQ